MKLIFIHGSGGTGADFHYQSQYFPDSDAVSLPGHPDGKACTSIYGYVEWLRGYIAGKGYEDVVLAGHSMGGGIILLYGFLYPEEVKGLIPVGSGARLRVHPKYLTEHHEGIANRDQWEKVRRAQPFNFDASVRDKLLEMELKVGPAVHYNDLMACDQFDLLDRVGEIKLPTLAICGTNDVMTPPLYSRYLEKHLENCRAIVMEGPTHSIMLERPQETNQAIEGFLSTLS